MAKPEKDHVSDASASETNPGAGSAKTPSSPAPTPPPRLALRGRLRPPAARRARVPKALLPRALPTARLLQARRNRLWKPTR